MYIGNEYESSHTVVINTILLLMSMNMQHIIEGKALKSVMVGGHWN